MKSPPRLSQCAVAVGRFAPSPTGPLHTGSLCAALASYLEVRQYGGRWLVRIEDIDPPRESPGAHLQILAQLTAHGLHWDGKVLYQSQRLAHYREIAAGLIAAGDAYQCSCTRSRLKQLPHSHYDGYCRHHPADPNQPAAIRLKLRNRGVCKFDDLFLGKQQQCVAEQVGDFPIWRRDGLVSYQLAVVVDDFSQGVTTVVRGADLLDNSGRQILLQKMLGYPTPRYGHIPVALDSSGQKLSKQNHAPCLPAGEESQSLCAALRHLGLSPDAQLANQSPEQIVEWALSAWRHHTNPIDK